MSKRPDPPSLNSFSIQMDRRLDWSELDQLGHANNARYFTWFEEARMAYFQAISIPTVNGTGWGPILAHTECHFLAPVTWPANLILAAKICQVGNSSLKMMYAAFLKAQTDENHPPSCVAHGSGIVVLVNYQSGQKVMINEELKQAIQEIEDKSNQ